jgi:glycosyltransferase involved in cell wall biosynthesis
MRVLFLSADPGVPILGHKGASVHARELIRALVELGADVHVASPRIACEGDVLEDPATLHEIPGVLPKACTPSELTAAVDAQARSVAKLVERHTVEAIYERFSLFSAAGVRAASDLDLPHCLEVNAPLREEAARFRTLPHPQAAAAIEREVLDGTDRVLAVSTVLADALGDAGVPADRLEVVPNGVAAHRFPEPRRDPTRFVVGFAGSLKPWHGVETMVQALRATSGETHLEVFGHGPLEEALADLPAERVTRLGARPHAEVLERMSGWDAGLAPYGSLERFWFSPLKVLEYMAAGTCPVVSDVGDACETLGDGQRGILVPPGDAGALADAIDSIATDRAKARELGGRARAWVRANRTWRANAERALVALGRRPMGAARQPLGALRATPQPLGALRATPQPLATGDGGGAWTGGDA